jgi:hypothetical integral membrane protein (TIGR02206 family)
MTFITGGVSHLVVLVLFLATAVVLIRWRRSVNPLTGQRADWIFAALLAAVWPASLFQYWVNGNLTVQNALPLHLCDLALVTGLVALLTRHAITVELTYYFALAGTSHGLLTPALDMDWPHPRFITFFAHHAGVVLAALYLVLGMRLLPRPHSVRVALLGIISYALIVGGINAVLGTNYGFLCAKPPTASILDHLGPWPWYVLVLLGIAVSIFILLYQPVRWLRSRSTSLPKTDAP